MAAEPKAGRATHRSTDDPSIWELWSQLRKSAEPPERLSADAYRQLVDLLASRLTTADDSHWLELAAWCAARHSELEHDERRVRSLLTLLASRHELTRQIGGRPREVFDTAEYHELTQARLRGEAMEAIWQVPMLEPSGAAVAMGAKPANREIVRQRRMRSWLLGLPRGRGYLYPVFQFDHLREDIFPEVRAVNELLGAADDPWGVASWWVSTNARVDTAPMELVGSDRSDDLPILARAVAEPAG